MPYQIPPQNWPDSDPAPNVPPLEEIQFADELRHRLELRLLPGNDAHVRRFDASTIQAAIAANLGYDGLTAEPGLLNRRRSDPARSSAETAF